MVKFSDASISVWRHVRDHPGCSKSDAALRRVGASTPKSSFRTVERAIGYGLVRVEPTDSQRVQLYAVEPADLPADTLRALVSWHLNGDVSRVRQLVDILKPPTHKRRLVAAR